jgi:uroporphyrinogen III methyltransferase/synthase
MRKLSGIRFAVIGNGTGDILERAGIYSDLKPLKFNSTALAEVLVKCVKKGERVLIPRSAEGSPELTDILTRAEVDFDDIPCYEPVYPTEKTGKTIDATFVIFTSKSGVNAFFEGGYDFSDTTMPLCIGASTAQALVKHKRVPPLMPHQSSVDGLIDIIREVTLR